MSGSNDSVGGDLRNKLGATHSEVTGTVHNLSPEETGTATIPRKNQINIAVYGIIPFEWFN